MEKMEECDEIIKEELNKVVQTKKLKKISKPNQVKLKTKPFFASIPSHDVVQLSPRILLYKTYIKYCSECMLPRMSDVKQITVSGAENLDGMDQKAFDRSLPNAGLLTSEGEAEVIRTIIQRLKMNSPMSSKEIIKLIMELNSQKADHQTKLRKPPSKQWITLFRKRFPTVFYGDLMTIQVEFNKDLTCYGYRGAKSQQLPETIRKVKKSTSNQSRKVVAKVTNKPEIRPKPTFEMMICRFCIEVTNENQRSIPSKFYSEFERLTGVELDQSNKYPGVLCENCYEKFTDILNYLQAISSNQSKLQKMFDGSNLTLNLQDYRHQNSNSSEYQLFQEIEPFEEFIIKQEPPEIESEVFEYRNVFVDNLNIESLMETSDDNDKSKLTDTIAIESKIESKKSDENEKIKTSSSRSFNPSEPNSSSKVIKPYQCDLCGRFFIYKSKAKCHILSKHSKELSFTCIICSKSFNTYLKLQYHTKIVHESGEFKCIECDKVFNNQHKLKIHFIIHQPKVMCTVCGQFFNKVRMRSHRRTHAEKVKCTICGSELKPDVLRIHMKEVHEEDEQTCEICGSIFGNKRKLVKHIARQHSESKLKCPVAWCSYTSARKPFIKLHLDHHRDIEQDEKDRLWLEVKKIKGFWK